jgi:antitoxin component of MazEF toxin-antitoxin module
MKRFIPKIQKFGGRNNPSYGIIIPKELVGKYKYNEENYVLLMEDEDKEILIIKKIRYE